MALSSFTALAVSNHLFPPILEQILHQALCCGRYADVGAYRLPCVLCRMALTWKQLPSWLSLLTMKSLVSKTQTAD